MKYPPQHRVRVAFGQGNANVDAATSSTGVNLGEFHLLPPNSGSVTELPGPERCPRGWSIPNPANLGGTEFSILLYNASQIVQTLSLLILVWLFPSPPLEPP